MNNYNMTDSYIMKILDSFIYTNMWIDSPENIKDFALIVHCGGCMLNEREVRYRMKCAKDQQVPITNYGIAIAFMQGILKRSVQMFPHLSVLFQDED